MSSPLLPEMVREAVSAGINVQSGARGFVFNADLVTVVQALDIGTRVARSR